MVALYKRFLIFITVVIGLVLLWHSGWIKLITFHEFKQSAESWHTWVQEHYWYALIGYCLFFITAGTLAIPVTIILTLVGGFLFGRIIGGIYAVLCATISSVIIVILIRYFLGKLVQEKYKKQLQSFNVAIEHHGAWYIMMMQVFPFTPAPLLNIGAGLSKISIVTFAWATAVGLVPGTLLYTFAGQYIHKIDNISDIVSWQTMVLLTFGSILLLLPVLWSYYKTQPE